METNCGDNVNALELLTLRAKLDIIRHTTTRLLIENQTVVQQYDGVVLFCVKVS